MKFTTKITSWTWWKAALIRAGRTALVVAIPYVPASYTGEIPYLSILSAGLLGALVSIVTSALTALGEVEGAQQPWWFAVLNRVAKTVGQAFIAGIGTAVFIQDVDWSQLGQMAITAGFGSLLLALLGQLPEAEKPIAQASTTVTVINEAGEATIQAVPITTPATLDVATGDIAVIETPSTPDSPAVARPLNSERG